MAKKARKKAEPKSAAPAPVRDKAPPELVEKLQEYDRPAAARAKALAEDRRAFDEAAIAEWVPPQQRKRKKKFRKRNTDDPDFRSLAGRVQAAVLALDELEDRGVVFSAKSKPNLAKLAAEQSGETISVRILSKAEKHRGDHPRERLR